MNGKIYTIHSADLWVLINQAIDHYRLELVDEDHLVPSQIHYPAKNRAAAAFMKNADKEPATKLKIKCIYCGTKNYESASICIACGGKLPEEPAPPEVDIDQNYFINCGPSMIFGMNVSMEDRKNFSKRMFGK